MKNTPHIASVIVLIILGSIIIGCQKSSDTDQLAGTEKEIVSLNSLYGSQEACGPNNAVKSLGTGISPKSVVIPGSTIFNTDFISAGAGGMRDVGNGQITLPATFTASTVTQAYLYWHGVTNSSTNVGNSIMVNSNAVSGTNIGVSSSNCWPFANSQAYRADVTSMVSSTGSGVYSLSGFGELNLNGASLIVFFNDSDNTNNRDVVIFEGNDSNIAFAGISGNPNAPADPQGWNVLLSGINYTSGNANIQLHVGDGQSFADAALLVNTSQIVPAGDIFQGNSVPGGTLWDIKSYDVTSFLSPGPNSLNLTTGLNSDCLSLIAALIDLPAGAAPPPPPSNKVAFDFSPLCCPNIFVCGDKGTVPAAIVGTSDFDIAKVDVSTIKLNGVSPASWVVKDVAEPFKAALIDCNSCTTKGPDGIKDLLFKFSNEALNEAFGTTTNKQCLKITITGKLLAEFGGTSFSGEDMISIKK